MDIMQQGTEQGLWLGNAKSVSQVSDGVPMPLGAHPRGSGINFAIFSRHATGATLLLFNSQKDLIPQSTIVLDPQGNRTGDIWHVWVGGIGPGSLYAWRSCSADCC